jgi:hypothetical protein
MEKILFVITDLHRAGTERVVSFLSQEFERTGYNVKIVKFQGIRYDRGSVKGFVVATNHFAQVEGLI